MTDLISIITPAYAAEYTIVAAVESVLNQSHHHWEMLIISDDHVDYCAILSSNGIADERLRFFKSLKVQSGPNASRNIGLHHARGEWIAPLDADDVYYPTRLAVLLDAAQETGLSLDNVKIVGEHIKQSTVLRVTKTQNTFVRSFSFDDFKTCLVPLLFLFHRCHIHSGWDEDIIRGADTLFNLRALESAGFACFVPEALHEYRVHSQSMCHAVGSENLFQISYAHTLKRLQTDGLGFRDETFLQQVIDMIEEKKHINDAFDLALKNGFLGNYQSFVKEYQK